jgi:aryl-alcohol dehydrogenase-like predicted oxidoreductase
MGLVVWSPLASGVLTGKYDDGIPAGTRLDRIEWLRESVLGEDKRDRVRRFGDVAKELGTTRARLALAWALKQTGVSSVITGATSVEQLDENLAALDVVVDDATSVRLNGLFP